MPSKKSLVIVESPTKAKTISRFLGAGFVVTSSMGHIRDLPKSKLGVDVEKNFEPHYVIPTRSKSVISELKKKAKSASEVVLATDEDREGEAIAWHLAQALGIKDEKIKRIVFHEITKPAILESLKSPRKLDKNLVDAQQARRVLDRLVGYELSPFLWKKVMRGLSAGRVQSVAVRLIVEREEEIEKFKPEEYWNILAKLSPAAGTGGGIFTARLHKIADKTLKKFDVKSEKDAKVLLKNLEGSDYQVADIQTKEVRRNPAPPFTTSTLQQDCARRFGYSARQTMMFAQQLYEGVDIGDEGSVGLITYMRTDSVNLAESALAQIAEVIEKKFGKEYNITQPRRYKTKSKGAQEAHEAIRPTDIGRDPESVKAYLDARQFKIYSLIWKRAVACQMAEAIIDQTAVDISATPSSGLPALPAGRRPSSPVSAFAEATADKQGEESPSPLAGEGSRARGKFIFRATGQVIKFDGFMRAYEIAAEKDEEQKEEYEEGTLPKLSVEEKLKLEELLPKQSFTEPQGRYNDASLIKALEEFGIGRPSTYAPILYTIQVRKYVERKAGRFHPTEIGRVVNGILVKNFPEIVDIDFTAKMEGGLDEIAEGKRDWQPMISEFYRPFKEHLVEKTESVEKHVEKTDQKCPTCGKPMVIKYGRFGKFMACSDYPDCKTTLPLPEDKKNEDELAEKYKDVKCELCGKPMNVRRGKFGYFLGCSDYPNCKGIKKIEKTTGVVCPQCGEGEIVQKRSRRGSFFFACNRYPKCDYTANKLPGEAKTQEEK